MEMRCRVWFLALIAVVLLGSAGIDPLTAGAVSPLVTPIANPDSYTANTDTAGAHLTVAAPGVLANDYGGTLTAIKMTDPSHGTVTLNSDGGFTYTPTANYTGPDSFAYKVNNGHADSAATTVSLTVGHVNQPPVIAKPGAQMVVAGAPLVFSTANSTAITVTDPDAGTAPIKVTLTVAHGTITDTNTVGGTVTITGSGTASLSLTGPQAQVNTSLDGISYTASVVYTGAETLAIHADDQGNTGSGGAQTADASVAITVTAVPVTHFTLSAPPSATAGAAFSITVTAQDAGNATVALYRGTIHFTSTDTAAVLPSDYTFTAGDAGVHTFTNAATLKTAGSKTITATDTVTSGLTGTSSLAVSAAAATHLTVSAPSSAAAGSAFSVTVTALDSFNNTATGYTGTIHFTKTDSGASSAVPSDYSFVGGDNGVHTFSNGATLVTPGNQTITATDTVTSSITGSASITVAAGGATHVTVNALGSTTAGAAFSVTVTVLDAFNNTVTGYTGTIHFTSTDTAAVLPGDYTFTAGDAGVHTFTNAATLKTAGNQTITATDTVTSSITGTTSNITVSAAAVTHLAVAAPSPQAAGTAFTVKVTAQDQFNNTVTGYAGTVHFTKTDNSASSSVPSDYAFVAGDNGMHIFTNGATLVTMGPQTITATDTVTSSITGTTGTVTVTAAAATHLTVAATSPQTAGTAFSVTVTAQDQFNNTVTGYTGTITFTSTDAQVSAGSGLPANYTFLAGDNGVHIFTSVILKTAGGRTITATDTVTSSITGTTGTITVNPGAATHFSVTAPPSANTGVSFSITVTALDAFTNTATGYAGTVQFTSTDLAATLPSPSTLTNGVGSFNATMATTGNQTITATDTVTSSITGTSGAINVINQAPVINASNVKESFDTVGNTAFQFAAAQTASPGIFVSGNLVANFHDPEGDPITAVAQTNAPTANGGKVTLATDGTFLFTPKAGDTAASDTFQYQVQDNHGNTTVARTVTITLTSRVWYVKNDAAGGGTGVSNAPFNTLASAQTASLTGDYIFVYKGDGTTTGQATGIVLKANQKLYGEVQGLTVAVPNPFNGGNPGTVTLVASNALNRPKITNAGGIGVSVPNVAGVEVRGLDIAGSTNAIGATTASGTSTGATITGNVISSAGTNGIDARTAAGATALTLDIDNNAVTAGGTGILIDGSAGGTTTITGFANNSISQNTVGTGISVTSATFDATPGGTFQTVAGGTTQIGTSGNGVGASGLVLTNVSGDLSFTDLDIFADGGAALRASGTTAYTGSAGFQITVGAGVATFSAVGGPAADLTTVRVNLPLASATSSNSATTGIALNSVLGTFTAGSGSITGITSGSGTAFQVSNSNATVSYAGTISVTTGAGVSLTSNTGSTISFTGTLTLSTGSSNGFVATGGGTVTSTDVTSTIVTTTGTALNVANTTIGASGLTFTSISANGATNGIVLNTTGTSGGLTVTGDGASDPANLTQGRTTAKNGGGTLTLGSGGTIQSATNAGVLLSSANNVTLRDMVIQNNGTGGANSGGDGVNATNGSALTLDNTLITGHTVNNGLHANGVAGITLQHMEISSNATNGAEVASHHEWNVRFDNVTGTATISNSLFHHSAENIIGVVNQNTTTLSLNVTNVFIHDTGTVSPGNDGLFLEADNSANLSLDLEGSMINNCRNIGVNYNGNNTSGGGTYTVKGSTFDGNGGNNLGGADINVAHNGAGKTVTFDIENNTTRQSFVTGSGQSISVDLGGQSTNTSLLQGKLINNTVGKQSVTDSGSANGAGIALQANGAGTITALISNNKVFQALEGLLVLSSGTTDTMNVTINSNNDFEVSNTNVNGFLGVELTAGGNSGSDTICANVTGNAKFIGSVSQSSNGIQTEVLGTSTINLQGYGGGANNVGQITTFLSTTAAQVNPGPNVVAAGGTIKAAPSSCPTPP